MALLKCKECGKEVSSKADKCPHCGAARANEPNGCAMGCLVVIIIAAVVYFFNSSNSSEPQKATPDDELAAFTCGDFIKKNLRDPDSADFITDPSTSHASAEPDGSYQALLTVRANNGFGGKTVSTFNCIVSKDADGNWILKSLNEL